MKGEVLSDQKYAVSALVSYVRRLFQATGGGGKTVVVVAVVVVVVGAYSRNAGPLSYMHRLPHSCNAWTEHVGFSRVRQTLLAPSAKCRELLGE